MALNQCSFIGNLGSDPEVKFLPAGDAVCNFSLAINSRRKGQDETLWVRVAVFGRSATACGEHLAKGRQVYVSGRISMREWEAKGKRGVSLELAANEVQFLGGKSDSRPSSAGPSVREESTPSDEDISF